MFHRFVADELGAEGFTCVALHPGWVRTDMGGADATLSPESSGAGLLAVIDRLQAADNGRILDPTGPALPG